MGVLRYIVFPALRLVVWAVIALALSVIAFGRDGAPVAGPPVEPGADLTVAAVPVSTGDIRSTIEVTGTVAADPATTVKATATGTVTKVRAAVGDAVTTDTPLFDVRVALPPAQPTGVTGPDGAVTSAPAPERWKTETVRAGATGTLATLAVLKNQEVSVGTDVATVSPGTLSVSAPLTQSQQFRLLAPPQSAEAQAPGGPAPFACTDLRTGATETPPGPPQPDPYTGMPVESPTATITCRVPPGTTVFAGMQVVLTIDTGSAEDVLVLPVSAVLGTVGEGRVWVVDDDRADPQERAVTLGLTDGEMVQITDGLTEGEQVLEFAPVPTDDEPQVREGF